MASFDIQKLISLCPICLFPLLFLLPCKTLENVATIYIGESFACVLFYEFYYVMSCLSVLATLSLFLCMMWGYLLASLIYMWLSNFPSTTYWRNCLFSIVYFASFVKNWLWVCGFISGLSMLFHWNICLFLCQYHTVLITVALWYCLKSGRVCLLLCSFSSGLLWQFWVLYKFHISLGLCVPVLWKMSQPVIHFNACFWMC